MNETKIIRVLRWFEKDPNDSLVGEAELRNITVGELNRIFGEQPNDPKFYACHPVQAQHVPLLQHHTKTFIDLTRYDYFIEYDAIDVVTKISDTKTT